jgi:hypothetical protein
MTGDVIYQTTFELGKVLTVCHRLKLKIRVTPNFKMMVTGHGNIKSYLYKHKITESAMCPCKTGEQTTDHTYII